MKDHDYNSGAKRHGNHRANGGGQCFTKGPISRVITGCKEATGLGKGAVITLFVLGFVFMPALTALVFLAMLYWTTYPGDARRNFDRVSRHVKRAGAHLSDAAFGKPGPRGPTMEPDFDTAFDTPDEEVEVVSKQRTARTEDRPDASELRDKFADLERRANEIEEFVASEEYRLEREFEKMDRHGK